MKIAMIGLGKMGGNLARNMKDNGHEVVVYNRSEEKTKKFELEGFQGVYNLEALGNIINKEDAVWLMIPSGEIVDKTLEQLVKYLEKGTLIIDGGNSNYKDTIRRYEYLQGLGYAYMDIGTSGGQQGAREGACMMVGGDIDDYNRLEFILKDICVENGVDYMGKHGSGHYVKMVHNGIEYGMMQAIAEGFDILEHSKLELDLNKIAKVYQNGSIISSYLVDKTADALLKDVKLSNISDQVDSSGEGLWTVEEALELGLPAYVITASLFKRFESKQDNRFSNKLLAAMRNEFGGHKVHRVGEKDD